MAVFQHPKLINVQTGLEIVITESPFLIGRGLHCNYVLTSEVISRQHCEFQYRENRWLLKDKSRNGTFVNGYFPMSDGVYLNNDDQITLSPEGHTYTFILRAPRDDRVQIRYISFMPFCQTESDNYSDEAMLSSFDSPLQVAAAAASSNSRTQQTTHLNPLSTPQVSEAIVAPVPSTSSIRTPPATTDAPSSKRTKLSDESAAIVIPKTENNDNPVEDCEPNLNRADDRPTAFVSHSRLHRAQPPDDYADILNTDLDLEAILSSLDSPLQVAQQTTHLNPLSTPQVNEAILAPVPSTSSIRTLPATTDAPSNKRTKLSDESAIGMPKTDNNGNPVEDCEPNLIRAETQSDTDETEEISKNKDTNMQQDQIEEMENEMQCSICSEMFVKATTLNCSHTFCKYCIEMWKKTRNICPICRAPITSSNATLVLDNVIEKFIKSSSDEVKEHRKALLDERKKLEEPKVPVTNPNHFGRNRGGNRNRGRRGRGAHLTSAGSRRQNNNSFDFANAHLPPQATLPNPVIEVESSSSDSDTSSNTSTDSDNTDSEEGWREEYDNDEWQPGVPGAYYGGYGHCFLCGRRGHWATGCPFT